MAGASLLLVLLFFACLFFRPVATAVEISNTLASNDTDTSTRTTGEHDALAFEDEGYWLRYIQTVESSLIPTKQPTVPIPTEEPTRFPSSPVPTAGDYFTSKGLVGFASIDAYGRNGTTGGQGGKLVTVRDAASFIYFIKRKGKYTVQVDGLLDLSPELFDNKTAHRVSSNTTIIGIGSKSGIRGAGLKIQNTKIEKDQPDMPNCPGDLCPEQNIIIRNMIFTDCPVDCIGMDVFSHHVWIDHNDFSLPMDGAIDLKRASDLVTISWNRFSNTEKTMLLGNNDNNGFQDEGKLRVTFHHNFFDGTLARHPRARFGEPVHCFNNFYYRNSGYGISSSMGAGLVVEGNFFEDVDKPMLTTRGAEVGRIMERYNKYLRSGDPVEGSESVEEPSLYYNYQLDNARTVPAVVPYWAGTGVIA